MKNRLRFVITLAVTLGWACMPPSGGGIGPGEPSGAGAMDPGGSPETGGELNGPGEACTGSDECESGVCVSLSGTRFCADPCDPQGICPINFQCLAGFCIPSVASGGGDQGGAQGTGGAGGASAPGGANAAGGMNGAGGGDGFGGMSGDGGASGAGGQVVQMLLCGVADPYEQCLEACTALSDCWQSVCATGNFVRELQATCRGNCPDPRTVDLVCRGNSTCGEIIREYTARDAQLQALCQPAPPDPCADVNCGINGECIDGRCECDPGFAGPRCERNEGPNADQIACAQFIACQEGCAANDCRDQCTNAFPDGARVLMRLSGCLQANGCLTPGGEIDDPCMAEFCRDAYNACFEDELVVANGDASCLEFNACARNCADNACRNQCINAANPDSVELYRLLQSCASNSGCADTECVEAACGDELMACRQDSSGPALCQDIVDCWFEDCPGNDEACAMRCYFNGRLASQDLFAALFSCMRDNQCMRPEECDECMGHVNRCAGDAEGP